MNIKSKIVHVDLKGAQPHPPTKAPFWEQWCTYVSKQCQVDGLLIEWEDCLPINLLSSSASNRFTYTVEEVNSLVHTAQNVGLAVIPLIQTFGHLEYLLKNDVFGHLREIPEFPDCLIPGENEGDECVSLIFRLIEEVLSFTPNISTIHLGGDEVWHLGLGERSKVRTTKNGTTKIELYLTHMNIVVQYIRRQFPHITNILIWDDMLRSSDAETIKVPEKIYIKYFSII